MKEAGGIWKLSGGYAEVLLSAEVSSYSWSNCKLVSEVGGTLYSSNLIASFSFFVAPINETCIWGNGTRK